jgi:hypothetical protein
MDFSGEKELSGAISEMCCLMVANEAGWKILRSSSRVISRVFEGGAGWMRGGSEERSSDSGERDRFAERVGLGEDAVEEGGDCERLSV